VMKVVTVVGTRPELIRLSRIIDRLDRSFEHILVHTGQNYDFELNQVFFDQLKIRKPDYFLGIASESLAKSISRIIELTDEVFEKESPDALLVLGDTNSGLCVIPAKRRKIPIFHMEAGNRCFDQRVPEEINRKIIDHTADINLAYTEHARRNLLAEGFPSNRIFVVGGTQAEVLDHHKGEIDNSQVLQQLNLKQDKYFVVSIHREENVDSLEQITSLTTSLNQVAETYAFPLIFSTHPRTRRRIEEANLSLHPLIQEMKPFGFFDYIQLQQRAFCTLSDSGTITEESAVLGFPAVALRAMHERPEGIDTGVVIATGTDPDTILHSIRITREQHEAGVKPSPPSEYLVTDVSWKVAKIITGYSSFVRHNLWRISQ